MFLSRSRCHHTEVVFLVTSFSQDFHTRRQSAFWHNSDNAIGAFFPTVPHATDISRDTNRSSLQWRRHKHTDTQTHRHSQTHKHALAHADTHCNTLADTAGGTHIGVSHVPVLDQLDRLGSHHAAESWTCPAIVSPEQFQH